MEKIISSNMLKSYAEKTLYACLDYIAGNCIYSPWTKKKTGWQEQWFQSDFSGTYATCKALPLLARHMNIYEETVYAAAEDLKYMFDNSIDYEIKENDSEEEKMRKNRCSFILAENKQITLRAVYFLNAYEYLKKSNILFGDETQYVGIIDCVYAQIESVFDEKNGCFYPSRGNQSDFSILTSAQAFLLMKSRWGQASIKTCRAKSLLVECVKKYNTYILYQYAFIQNKFEIYSIKSNFVVALYALSHSLDYLDMEDRELITSTLFLSINDIDIRSGFSIKDCFTVPGTLMSRDTYSADSRLLYLESIIYLIDFEIISPMLIEYFIDDFWEIINTAMLKKQYLAWDSAPSFSHNIRGLTILQSLVDLLSYKNIKFTACNVSSWTTGYRIIDPKSVVLFMSFSKNYTESVQESVREVLSYIGFEMWCATNNPYDVLVVESIFEKLSKSQFVIIDCSERSANVMYEAGLAHGLGKLTLLCGSSCDVFPYENEEYFDICIFESDGDNNPPPYRDLQKGILEYVIDMIDSFCLAYYQRNMILEKAKVFMEEYCK